MISSTALPICNFWPDQLFSMKGVVSELSITMLGLYLSASSPSRFALREISSKEATVTRCTGAKS